MHYFTRDVLRRGGLHWKNALEAYRKHFSTITPRLSPCILDFHRVGFHDQVIEHIERRTARVVALHTDAYEIVFDGVSSMQVRSPGDGDVWLYDELDSCKDGQTQLCVLLEQGEFTIVFDTVSVFDKASRKWRVPPCSSTPQSKPKRKRGRRA